MQIPEALTDELVHELGFIYSKDDFTKPSSFPMTFAEFLDKVIVKGLSEEQIIAEARQMERSVIYYNHFKIKELWGFTFEQFYEKVRNGAWELRFTA